MRLPRARARAQEEAASPILHRKPRRLVLMVHVMVSTRRPHSISLNCPNLKKTRCTWLCEHQGQSQIEAIARPDSTWTARGRFVGRTTTGLDFGEGDGQADTSGRR